MPSLTALQVSWFTSRLYFLLALRRVSRGPSVRSEWRQQMYSSHTRWLENRQQVISLKSRVEDITALWALLSCPESSWLNYSVKCMQLTRYAACGLKQRSKLNIYSEWNSLCHGFGKDWFYVLGQSRDCELEVSAHFSGAEALQEKSLFETTLPPTGQQ